MGDISRTIVHKIIKDGARELEAKIKEEASLTKEQREQRARYKEAEREEREKADRIKGIISYIFLAAVIIFVIYVFASGLWYE